jgi:hypothetical protein
MRNSHAKLNPRRLIIVCIALSALAALPLISSARSTSSSLSNSSSVTIVNNSSRQIRNVYLSRVDVDDWGANQLTDAIAPGQSVTIGNFSCDTQQIKVIGEDQDGCFLSAVVACGTSSTWTITNDSVADCGQ